MRRFGGSSLLVLLLTACVYGFSGGGLPSHIRNVAVQPFDNQTSSPEVQLELQEQLRHEIRSRLGLRDAPIERADAVVRGIIVAYDADIPVAFSADQRQATSARRKLQITVDVTITDQTSGRMLMDRKGLRAEGEYPERGEAVGRRNAIQRIVSDVIEGAQSQW